MPIARKIGVSFSKKFNVGNYESEEIGFWEELDLEEGDDRDKLRKALYRRLRRQVFECFNDRMTEEQAIMEQTSPVSNEKAKEKFQEMFGGKFE